MEIRKINNTYINDNYVQLGLSNSDFQIITDERNLLYLQYKEVEKSFDNALFSKRSFFYNNYILDINKIYFRYSSDPIMDQRLDQGNFNELEVYAFRKQDQDLLMQKMSPFSKIFREENNNYITNRDGVIKFLSLQPDEGFKCIVVPGYIRNEIKYFADQKQGLLFDEFSKILEENEIIEKEYKERNSDVCWIKGELFHNTGRKSIEQIKNYDISSISFYGWPSKIITGKDGIITAKEFVIKILKKDEYEIFSNNYVINKNKFIINNMESVDTSKTNDENNYSYIKKKK